MIVLKAERLRRKKITKTVKFAKFREIRDAGEKPPELYDELENVSF